MYTRMYVCMYGHTYSKSMDQPGKFANLTHGQLNLQNPRSNTLPSILLDSNNTAQNQRKKGRSKCQVSIRLHASMMEQMMLLNDFGYPKISAIAIDKTTSQLRTNSTRQNSKRLRKFSLLNRSVLEDEIPSRIIPSYEVSPAANKKA